MSGVVVIIDLTQDENETGSAVSLEDHKTGETASALALTDKRPRQKRRIRDEAEAEDAWLTKEQLKTLSTLNGEACIRTRKRYRKSFLVLCKATVFQPIKRDHIDLSQDE